MWPIETGRATSATGAPDRHRSPPPSSPAHPPRRSAPAHLRPRHVSGHGALQLCDGRLPASLATDASNAAGARQCHHRRLIHPQPAVAHRIQRDGQLVRHDERTPTAAAPFPRTARTATRASASASGSPTGPTDPRPAHPRSGPPARHARVDHPAQLDRSSRSSIARSPLDRLRLHLSNAERVHPAENAQEADRSGRVAALPSNGRPDAARADERQTRRPDVSPSASRPRAGCRRRLPCAARR